MFQVRKSTKDTTAPSLMLNVAGAPPVLDDEYLRKHIGSLPSDIDVTWVDESLKEGDVVGSVAPGMPWHYIVGSPKEGAFALGGNTLVFRAKLGEVTLPAGVLLALREVFNQHWGHQMYLNRFDTRTIMEQHIPEQVDSKGLEKYIRLCNQIETLREMRKKADKLMDELSRSIANNLIFKKGA